ncbi:DUF3048 domain-containing protein [Lachnospiraceae bacterium 29-84]
MKKRMVWLLIAACVLGTASAGCGKKAEAPEPVVQEEPEEEPPEEPEEPEEEPEEETAEEPEEESREGMAKSYLTGEWIDEELAGKRPLAVMIGNTSDALPQYGISDADIIYEVPVEGSYTRLMAIFQDYAKPERIGSVRSCRHYFIYFAKEFDAIYTHFGQAVYAEPILAQDDVHNLSGLDSSIGDTTFYRDSSRKAPHNVFTDAEKILAGIGKKGYRTELSDSYSGHYKFAEDDASVQLDGEDALVVSPGYFVNKPWFVYDKKDGLYYRYEFKDKHIDGANDQQLAVKNILVQYCAWSYKDENGYMDIDTVSGGDAIYITNGKMEKVTWKKEGENAPARYFAEDGEEITLNQGKTWVCIARDKYKDRFAVYADEDEMSSARSTEE